MILGPGGDRMGVGGPDAYEDLQQGLENLIKALRLFPCGSCRLRRQGGIHGGVLPTSSGSQRLL